MCFFLIYFGFFFFLPLCRPGAIAGLLAARYLAPALVWGGVGEADGIRPDSRAASWAVRREALTNQYVSRMAAQATGKAALNDDDPDWGHSGTDGGAVVTKNLSQLSAGALQVCLFVWFWCCVCFCSGSFVMPLLLVWLFLVTILVFLPVPVF